MTIQHLEATKILVRLTKKKIGIKEAAILFACVDGAKAQDLCDVTGEELVTIRGRLSVLSKKDMIKPRYTKDGVAVYRPTRKGMLVINQTLGKQ